MSQFFPMFVARVNLIHLITYAMSSIFNDFTIHPLKIHNVKLKQVLE